MAIVQVSIVPLGTGSTSLSSFVAKVSGWLEAQGVKYELTPMGTILEGDAPEILSLIAQMHELPFLEGAARVMTLINLDDRRDKKATAQGKVESVARKLGKIK
ncbi:MAG: MTH1187 family thiamine-binding protein [Deltaproteobacteria bacterium]|nr:MTH1187 family thiamine-binding protein [Deltaproteobacteria bacterium]MBW2053734.1 MTH1187 family thiamine-binding protein [Deltaproteobacteria bacterium]MBW2141333.1 MTH1187 family thiamine-binding protein [Deltaproteobacteria bacterium]MBW2324671.1 MTH1187 family thiamine-binding protein [Deltaproteobacteria bacterium]